MTQSKRNHSNIKCPKCGSPPIQYREVWGGKEYQFCVKGGEIEEHGYVMEPDPEYVIAECGNPKCNHTWRLRGVSQITEIRA